MIYEAVKILSPFDVEKSVPEHLGVAMLAPLLGGAALGGLFDHHSAAGGGASGAGAQQHPQSNQGSYFAGGPNAMQLAQMMQRGGLPFMQNYQPGQVSNQPFQPQQMNQQMPGSMFSGFNQPSNVVPQSRQSRPAWMNNVSFDPTGRPGVMPQQRTNQF